MIEQSKKRMEMLRRALLNIMAQQHDADTTCRYTLDIPIVPKDQARKIA